MSDKETRRLVREMLSALKRALPAMRQADRAYRALMRPKTAKTHQRREDHARR